MFRHTGPAVVYAGLYQPTMPNRDALNAPKLFQPQRLEDAPEHRAGDRAGE